MIEVKVSCACGQRFKFDVEPVNGQMPHVVNCPVCGADGTSQANEIIRQQLAAPLPQSPPSPPLPPAAGLRLNRPHAAATTAPAVAGAAPITPAPVSAKATPGGAHTTGGDGFFKGVMGALVGSLLGMVGWYFLIKATGYEIGYAAWAVGGVTGLGARVVGAKGTSKLGVVAGAFAFIAIIGGEYLAVKSAGDQEFEKLALVAYQEEVDKANAAVVLTSDTDLRAFIAKHNSKSASEVSAEELKDFRENELPRLRELAAGKPSKAEYVRRVNAVKNSLRVQFMMLKESVGLFTLLWLFLGVGSAYKLGAGTND